MTNPSYTHLAVLLDRSGSMHSIKTDTEGGFAAFIEQQLATPGRCDVTLAQFDDVYEEVYVAKPLASVPPLDLRPRNSTALLDAIGRLVTSTGERLAALPEDDRPGSVLVVIMTDGLENASREYTKPVIRQLIEQQETTYGWTFVYLGANQDAIAVGEGLGVRPGMSLNYAGAAAPAAMAATSRNLSHYRTARAAGRSVDEARAESAYTHDQRAESMGDSTAADEAAPSAPNRPTIPQHGPFHLDQRRGRPRT